jgi:prophage antirepressor-like protein
MLKETSQNSLEHKCATEDSTYSDAQDTGNQEKPLEVTVFNNPLFGSVRIVTKIDGEPLFVVNDIYSALYILRRGRRGGSILYKGKELRHEDEPGQLPDHVYFSEESLYRFLDRADKPAERQLRAWIESEVVPSFRSRNGNTPSPAETEVSPEKVDPQAPREETIFDVTVSQETKASDTRRETAAFDSHRDDDAQPTAKDSLPPEKAKPQAPRTGAAIGVSGNAGAPRDDTRIGKDALALFENP